jgi:acyl carrier protein
MRGSFSSLTPLDVKKWDSLGQLNLITALEKKFSILFETEDVFKIISVKSIIDIVSEKVNK